MDQATLDAIVGRRELEDILSLRSTQIAKIIRTPEERFPAPVKVLEDGTRLWSYDDIVRWAKLRWE